MVCTVGGGYDKLSRFLSDDRNNGNAVRPIKSIGCKELSGLIGLRLLQEQQPFRTRAPEAADCAAQKLGGKSLREILSMKEQQREIDRVISQTVAACETMSKERTGVLIVFERSASTIDYQKTGTVLDAEVSSELLRNLFFTKAALHDGAVIIRNERIAAAGCVLPLTQNRNISSDLGTRHRAAIGMSEATDAVVVIVSEETGTMSVAIGGMLKRHLAPQTLEKLLLNELAPKTDEKTRNPLKKLMNKTKKGKDESDDAET